MNNKDNQNEKNDQETPLIAGVNPPPLSFYQKAKECVGKYPAISLLLATASASALSYYLFSQADDIGDTLNDCIKNHNNTSSDIQNFQLRGSNHTGMFPPIPPHHGDEITVPPECYGINDQHNGYMAGFALTATAAIVCATGILVNACCKNKPKDTDTSDDPSQSNEAYSSAAGA